MSRFRDGAYYLYRFKSSVGLFTVVQQNDANEFVTVKWIFGNEKNGLKRAWRYEQFQSRIDQGDFILLSWEEVLLAHKIFL